MIQRLVRDSPCGQLTLDLIAPVSGHCLPVTLLKNILSIHFMCGCVRRNRVFVPVLPVCGFLFNNPRFNLLYTSTCFSLSEIIVVFAYAHNDFIE